MDLLILYTETKKYKVWIKLSRVQRSPLWMPWCFIGVRFVLYNWLFSSEVKSVAIDKEIQQQFQNFKYHEQRYAEIETNGATKCWYKTAIIPLKCKILDDIVDCEPSNGYESLFIRIALSCMVSIYVHVQATEYAKEEDFFNVWWPMYSYVCLPWLMACHICS